MIIAIDGPDGVGKSTVAKAIAEKLGGNYMHFPNYDTKIGAEILAVLNKKKMVTPLALQCMNVCNRMETMQAYMGGTLVLDRYTLSATVYSMLDNINVITEIGIPKPDIQIVITSDKPFRLSGDLFETPEKWEKTRKLFKMLAYNTSSKIGLINNVDLDNTIEEAIKFIREYKL